MGAFKAIHTCAGRGATVTRTVPPRTWFEHGAPAAGHASGFRENVHAPACAPAAPARASAARSAISATRAKSVGDECISHSPASVRPVADGGKRAQPRSLRLRRRARAPIR